ncbi:WecB/TagA/CpsF family glycosyltransferase [Pengzhenrongella sicca]|uniref:WecB/TagA/CpsF family glycosyltransferase n=1 Tax=Pengzhenrongella sicca TaxID=2819238 RepID=A0A8A4ZGZ0_9MICO|nr:WecB/TagA/CpsF family glycosyltransferase [Pengzhenrongella sicca]QTE28908.1 WecB/TagA/CpsF family glycosyltransferase [Pengzhenrongella sicca]
MAVHPSGVVTLAGRELFLGDQAELLARIESLLPARGVLAVITPNVDQTLNYIRIPDLRRAYDEAEIRITDGFPLVKLGQLLGASRLQRHTGADLLPLVSERSLRNGWRIAVTGGEEHVAQAAADKLRKLYDADVVAVPFPYISSVEDDASRKVVDELVRIQPDLVFVCLGSPKQDVWVSHWRSELPPALYIGAGAAVDFVAGTKKRAPKVVQRLGGEWFYRMVQEPRRLAWRYLIRGPRFLYIAARSLIVAREGTR